MENSTPFLTVLTAKPEQPQCKTITPAGAADPALGYFFHWREEPIDGFDALARVLDTLQSQPCDVAVMGRVRDDARDRRKIRRLKYEQSDGAQATIEDHGSRFLHLDLDDLPLPAGSDWRDPAALAAWTWEHVGARFKPLRGVSCWWQASGSAGTAGKADKAKFHFWIMLDAPMVESQRRAVLTVLKKEAGADTGVGCPIQKNFTAPPRFIDVPDPLAGVGRSGVIRGDRDQMDTAAALKAAPPLMSQSTGGAGTRRAVEMPSATWLAETRMTPQGAAILAQACETIRKTKKDRNPTIFKQSARVGRAIRDGLIEYAKAEIDLIEAGDATGHPRSDEAVANGLKAGLQSETLNEAKARLGAALAQRSVSETDTETLLEQARWGEPARLPDRDRRTLLRALQDAGGDKIDVPLLVAAVLGIARGIPARLGVDDLREIITEHAPGVSRALCDALIARVQWSVDQRAVEALKPVTISDSRRFGDGIAHEYVDRLTPPSLGGVTVVRAPLGSGKTQGMAAPWVAAAKAAGGRVLAICPRRSLVAELGNLRLDLAHYEDKTAWDDMESRGGLAICSPSVTAAQWQHLPARWVVIDEIGQVLRFLGARDHCRTRNGTAQDVEKRIRALIREADGVLLLDGQIDDRVVDYVRECRPDETIQIIEMPESDTGIEADVMVGGDADADAIDRAARVMVGGGKVWISCEGVEKTESIGAFLGRFGRVLTITADTKLSDAQAAFLRDPEGQSRLYDAVVASPVISSGLSIEHRDGAHFTEGFLFASGSRLPPADVVQMMRRVRYLKKFTLALSLSNLSAGRDAKHMLDGAEAAAADEGSPRSRTMFDRLVAGYKSADANSRGDFANNLWFQLTAAGWTLRRVEADKERGALVKTITRDVREQRRAERAQSIVKACRMLPVMSGDEIEAIRREGARGDDRHLVKAWQWTLALGKATLTAEDVAFLDDDGIAKLDIFDDLDGHGAEVVDQRELGQSVIHRRYHVARAQYLSEIFDGFDVLGDQPWLDKESARVILDRIARHADKYVAAGAVPRRYAARFGSKDPVMPRDPVKAVIEIMGRAGVRMVPRQVRIGAQAGENAPECHRSCRREIPNDDTICDRQASSDGKRRRIYVACQDSVTDMRARAEQRRRAAEKDGHPAHNVTDNILSDKEDLVEVVPVLDPTGRKRRVFPKDRTPESPLSHVDLTAESGRAARLARSRLMKSVHALAERLERWEAT